MTFRDRYGFLHDKKVIDGNPETSENAPFYDGLDIALRFMNHKLYANEAWEYVKRTELLYGLILNNPEFKAGWKTTPISNHFEMSRDNWAGIFMGLECCMQKSIIWDDKNLYFYIKRLKKKIPIFHKQLDHPRDFLQVVGFKYKLLRPFTMWASKLSSLVTMYQTHKHKNNPERPPQAKTDGKLIAKGLCIAFNWKWTLYLMNKMLNNKRPLPLPDNAWHLVTKNHIHNDALFSWSWDSWTNIALDYFKTMEHEIVQKIAKSKTMIK